jgi:glycosyltransferase involved in cell wall biosynthesis
MLRQHIKTENQVDVAYALTCYDARNSGVYKKIADQTKFWSKEGLSFRLIVISDEASRPLWMLLDENAIIFVDSSFSKKIINKCLIVWIASKHSKGVVYLRDNFPLNIPSLKKPIILEVQSLVYEELSLRKKSKGLIFRISKRFVYRNIFAAVYVSNELRSANEIGIKESKPKTVISNGINLDRIKILDPVTHPLRPAVFFVGHPGQSWHGLQELIELAGELIDIDFYIVGCSFPILSSNIFAFESIKEIDYLEFARKSTVGIGTLRLSDKKMTEASPLKVREYLALGLPVITRYIDTDFPSPEEFILQLPMDESKAIDHKDVIREFILRWSGKRVPRELVNRISSEKKEADRLMFFNDVLNKWDISLRQR